VQCVALKAEAFEGGMPFPHYFEQVLDLKENSMFDWLSKVFNSKPNETLELSEEEKKRSDDGFVSQVLIFPSANNALNPNSSADNADAGSSDGGGGGGE